MDTTLELRFDRYLRPDTAVRQSVAIYSGSADSTDVPLPVYDVVERVVVYHLKKLEPGARYTVELTLPKDEGDFGFRAFDGAPVEEGEIPLTFDFRTRKSETVTPDPPSLAYADTCALLDALAPGKEPEKHAGCSSRSCHGGPEPRMGLNLGSAFGLVTTAIDRVARQTETGARSGVPLEDPPRVGVNMPIIDLGRPENSYLMYKLLRNPENFRGNPGVGCTTVHHVPLPDGVCPEPSAAESQRLADYFVPGLPMPYNDHSADLRAIQAWIRETTIDEVTCDE